MAGGFKFGIDFDSSNFRKGTEDAAESVENLADALEKAGKTDLDQLDDSLDQVDDSAKKVEEKIRDLLNIRETGTEKSIKAIDDGAERAGSGVNEFRDEAVDSMREAAASFDGSAASLADMVQEISANAIPALGALGPLGNVVGIAMAAGIGTAIGKLQEMADEVNTVKEEAGSAAVELTKMSDVEIHQRLTEQFEELASTITDNRQWFEVWQEDAQTAIEDVANAMGDATGSAEEFVRSFDVTDPAERLEILTEAAKESQEQIDLLEQKAKDAITSSDGLASSTSSLTEKERERLDNLRDSNELIDKAVKQQEAEIEITKALAEAKGQTVEEYQEYLDQQAQVAESQESYNDLLRDSADPVETYNVALEKGTGRAASTMKEFLAEQTRIIQQNKNFQANLERLADRGVDQGLIAELRGKGPAVAGATASMLAKSGSRELRQASENYGKINGGNIGQGTAAGIRDKSGQVASEMRRSVRVAEREANIDVRLNTSSFNSEVQNAMWRIPTQIVRAKMELIRNP